MRTARDRRRIWRGARRAAEQARDDDWVEETQSPAEETEGEKWRRKKWGAREKQKRKKGTPCTLSSTSQTQQSQQQQHQQPQQCACSDAHGCHRDGGQRSHARHLPPYCGFVLAVDSVVSGIDIFAFSTWFGLFDKFPPVSHREGDTRIMRTTDVMIAMWARVARSFSVVLVLVCPLPMVYPIRHPLWSLSSQHLAFHNVAPSQVMQYIAPAPVVCSSSRSVFRCVSAGHRVF